MPEFTLFSRNRFVRAVGALALTMVVATIAACGSDTTSVTGPTNVVGTYSLVTIDGNSLPFTVTNNPSHTVVIQSATFALGSDHSYTLSGTGTSDGGDPTQLVADAGTYALSGSTVTFTSGSHSGLVYTGAATSSSGSANVLQVVVPGVFAGSTNTSFTLIFNK